MCEFFVIRLVTLESFHTLTQFYSGSEHPMRQTLLTFTSAGFDVKAAIALARERCSRATAFSTTEADADADGLLRRRGSDERRGRRLAVAESWRRRGARVKLHRSFSPSSRPSPRRAARTERRGRFEPPSKFIRSRGRPGAAATVRARAATARAASSRARTARAQPPPPPEPWLPPPAAPSSGAPSKAEGAIMRDSQMEELLTELKLNSRQPKTLPTRSSSRRARSTCARSSASGTTWTTR